MTFPYLVIPLYEQEPIMERGDTLSFWIRIMDKDSTVTDPSTVSLSILDPCKNTILSATAMTSDTAGTYYYNYNVGATAMYGKYTLRTTLGDGTNTTIYDNEIYIMPWNVMDETRSKSGMNDEKSLPNNVLANLCWSAYKETLAQLFVRHYAEYPDGNPTTNLYFDGTNKSFKTRYHPIADHDGDGIVTGWGEQSCSTDVNCEWYDSSNIWHQGKVSVTQAKSGEIQLMQTSGNAIPSTNTGVYVYYHTEPPQYDEEIFREAVAYLAAHNAMETLKRLDRVTLADLNTNRIMIEKDADRFKRKYKELLRLIIKTRIRGTR